MSESVASNSIEAEQTLIFRGKLTEQDVVDLNRYRDALMLSKRLRRFATGLTFGFILLLVIAQAFRKEKLTEVTPVVGIGAVLAGAYLALVYYPMHRLRLVRRHFRKHVDDYQETTVTLTPRRVLIDNPAARSDFEWKLIGIVADTSAGMLFCTADFHVYFWLPERLLASESKQLVIHWAERNNVRVRQI